MIQGKAGENSIRCHPDGAVELYYDNSLKFATNGGGAKVTGDLQFDDNGKVELGGSDDLQLYHDGSNSLIKNGSGSGSLNLYGDDVNILNAAGGEWKAKFISNGSVELYYDDSKKFNTSSGGCYVIGNLYPGSNNTGSLGTSSEKWNTIYAGSSNFGDINMSNTDSIPNEVDGTRGSWTLQEGADDLFLINRTNGKKYKFNITEVS